jgi:hypothetical protein
MREIVFFDGETEPDDKPPLIQELAAAEEAIAGGGEVIEVRNLSENPTEPESPSLSPGDNRQRVQNAIVRAQMKVNRRNVPTRLEAKTAAERYAEFVDAKVMEAIDARLGAEIESLSARIVARAGTNGENAEQQKFPVARTERSAKMLDLLDEQGYLLTEDDAIGQESQYLDPTGWVVAKLLADGRISKQDKYLLLGANRRAAKAYIAKKLALLQVRGTE